MNILMIGPNSSSKGGMATVIDNFKEHYRNHNVYYLDTWNETNKYQAGFGAFWNIRKQIKQKKIDLVHFHVAQKGSFFRKALLAERIRKECSVIFHMHASQFDTFYESSSSLTKKFIKNTFSKLDKIVVLSKEWESYYKKITSTDIEIIENAVPTPQQNHYQSNREKIITLGRLGKRKGSYDLLEVAKKVGKSFPNVKFVLYGDGELEKVKQKIVKMKINNVEIAGWLKKENKQEVLDQAMLHFLPSYQEGLPMAILETMAEGIPNLSTNVGGIPQVVTDNFNGYLSQPGDTDDMADKIITFLESMNIRETFSNNAYETVRKDFSVQQYFQKWTTLYNQFS